MTDLFAGGEPLPIPLEAQIIAVEREIGMRIQVYGRRVDAGQMKREKAHAEISAMRAVLRTLKGVAQGQLVQAGQLALTELREILVAHGACDHDVGICACSTIRAADALAEALG